MCLAECSYIGVTINSCLKAWNFEKGKDAYFCLRVGSFSLMVPFLHHISIPCALWISFLCSEKGLMNSGLEKITWHSRRQNQLHNFQGPVQNENMEPCVQRLLRISRWQKQRWSQVSDPSQCGTCRKNVVWRAMLSPNP